MVFESHIGKPLTVHLKETSEIAEHFLGDDWNQAAQMMCVCHDFGKYTTYFQKRLHTGDYSDRRADHSYISALFGAFVGLRLLEQQEAAFYLYHGILCHHGSVDFVGKGLPETSLAKKALRETLKDGLHVVGEQMEDMRDHLKEIQSDYALWNLEDVVQEFLTECDLESLVRQLKRISVLLSRNTEQGGDTYFHFQLMYSALIAADKFSASDTPVLEPTGLSFESLEKSRKEILVSSQSPGRENMNRMREALFTNVMQSMAMYGRDSKICSITSPTGSGKTYAGFFAASLWNEMLGGGRKIIYALPFTSIINQNYDKIYELYERQIPDFSKRSGPYLMKHHSLADVDYRTENYEINRVTAEMLRENWSAQVIVTTFVQLLETLISNRNRMLKKFHDFNHAILLLDEVQAIPIELLGIVDFILQEAVRLLDCRILLMTATRPIFLTQARELLTDYRGYFEKFSRTKLQFDPAKKTIEEFSQTFLEELKKEISYLIVCNTIQESVDLYHQLEGLDRPLYYLSANLLPCDREKQIKTIEMSLQKKEYPIVVCTQVIEAGVDLSFDCVIRDLAPLASIIQAAGRCKRHGTDVLGVVKVVHLVKQGRAYGETVYGYMQIHITEELLSETPEVHESGYLDLIDRYYQKVNACKSNDVSDAFVRSIRQFIFTDEKYSIDKFHLIQEKSGYVEVYFRINEEAENLYQEFLEAVRIKDWHRRQDKMLEIQPKMCRYTLSIPQRLTSKINHLKGELLWSLPKEGCEEYYDSVTGFKREPTDDFIIL